MNRLLYLISRILVGTTFIFSGFVKAVDPLGSAIKFSDYLSAFHMEGLISLALPAAFIVAALEFITGLHLLIGIRLKTFSWMAIIFMAIFTPLTLYAAISNPVTDCGCFGDALKLTNWQTFFKNLVISLPAIHLFYFRKTFTDNIKWAFKWMITIFFTGGILGISQFSYQHLPLLDFRPFKIGNNITEGMSIPEDAEQAVYETTFLLEKDGVQKVFTAADYPYNDSTWVFISNETKVINKGYEPPIHDFVLTDADGVDQAANILNSDTPVLLVISSQISKGTWSDGIEKKIIDIKNTLFEKGMQTWFLTSSPDDDITKFEFDGDGGFNYLGADETMLKTIIRSNPGLVLLQKGNVIAKWHFNDLPEASAFTNPISYSLKEFNEKHNRIIIFMLIFVSVLILSLLLKRNKSI